MTRRFTDLRLALAMAVIVAATVATSAQADFFDGFDAAGDVANLYTYSQFPGAESGNADAHTFANGDNFALEAAMSRVHMNEPTPHSGDAGEFKLMKLTRNLDPANQFDVTVGTSLTINATSIDVTPYAARPNPVVFGYNFGGGTPELEVIISKFAVFDPAYQEFTVVEANSGGAALPGGFVGASLANPEGADVVLSIDATNYSLTIGGTPVIPSTAHGKTFNATDGAIPFFQARHVFNGGSPTDFYVQSFAGTGRQAIPEPATLTLLAACGLFAVGRRKRS